MVFVVQAQAGHRLTVSVATPVLAVFVLRVLGFAAVWLHESGHALVIVRNDRRVGRAGVGFYWGSLTFFVDASQALFFGRRTRMLQSSAGLIDRPVPVRTASLVAATGGDASWAVLLREFAVLGYLVLINAVPLLELDGYWFLADALDRPTLQRDARRALAATLRRQRANLGLAAYAAASLVFGIALVVLGFAAWWALFGGLFRTLWEGGLGYKLLAAYLCPSCRSSSTSSHSLCATSAIMRTHPSLLGSVSNAASSLPQCGASTANSSPPYRLTMSPTRNSVLASVASAERTTSPASWP